MYKMLSDLLIHPRTLLQLQRYLVNPTHGLILSGPIGAGKLTIAEVVATTILNLADKNKLALYPYYTIINPEDTSIPIDEIRRLEQVLKLKTPSQNNQEIRRIITIIDAGRMRFEAQNAFLKNLEEPPADTCIIMTTEANGTLLPTIYSRMVTIDVLPVSEKQVAEYYTKKGVSGSILARNFALSQGQVGLLSSLLGDGNHPLKNAVDMAKKLLSAPACERLFSTDELSKDKVSLRLLLNALSRICHAAVISAGTSGDITMLNRWRSSLAAVQYANTAISKNANTKLLLDHLLLNI